jgi:hypothetical protein
VLPPPLCEEEPWILVSLVSISFITGIPSLSKPLQIIEPDSRKVYTSAKIVGPVRLKLYV